MTETPGIRISREALRMSASRYRFARDLARQRRVLEIACGAGQGLGYVQRQAAWVVGGDISASLLTEARAHYVDRVPLVRFDGHALPFQSGSFDLIQIHEAIYYMKASGTVFAECRRVLRQGGILVVSTINPAWRDFNPSPHATSYLEAAELRDALQQAFVRVRIQFGFPVDAGGLTSSVVALIKRTAVRFGLIPRTMKSKTLLKRLFLGPLILAPAELTEDQELVADAIDGSVTDAARYRIIYAVAE